MFLLFLSPPSLENTWVNTSGISEDAFSCKSRNDYRLTSFYCTPLCCTSQVLCFLQIEGKIFHQQNNYALLYCSGCTGTISEVCLYSNQPNSKIQRLQVWSEYVLQLHFSRILSALPSSTCQLSKTEAVRGFTSLSSLSRKKSFSSSKLLTSLGFLWITPTYAMYSLLSQ